MFCVLQCAFTDKHALPTNMCNYHMKVFSLLYSSTFVIGEKLNDSKILVCCPKRESKCVLLIMCWHLYVQKTCTGYTQVPGKH